ncbi:MAG: DNA-processing protein DprA [Saprospiraceae bacterium]
MFSEENRSAVALSYLRGVGPIRARKLLAFAGGFAEALKLNKEDLKELGIPITAITQMEDGSALRAADEELLFLESHGVSMMDCLDEAYPKRLLDCGDGPTVVYYRGEAKVNPSRTVGIVGTRKVTSQGISFCEELVDQLKDYNVTVMSGLAYGVDITAHNACLRAGVPTIGVLAHGLGEIYPTAHRATAKAMQANGGLMTEYPSGLRSRKEFFPQRNRIIAGMSDALIVIESGKRGGSMITANLAIGYHKPVFAMPGRLKDPMSEGCNELIKTHRGHLLQSVEDIGYILGWKPKDRGQPTGRTNLLFQTLGPEEQRLVDFLQSVDDVDVDTLALKLAVPSGTLAATLLELEFKGVLRSLPGKRYTLA